MNISLSGPAGHPDDTPPLDLNGPVDLPFRRLEAGWVERPAFELFRESARRYPDRIACDSGADHVTYRQLLDAAESLARRLAASTNPGEGVGLLLPNDAHYPIAVLGCLAAARPCIMLDRYHPAARIASIVEDAGLSTLLVKRADLGSGLVPPGTQALVIDDDATAGSADPATALATPLPPDAPAFVVYTSGSTGLPKGIVLSQRSVLHRAAELLGSAHLNGDDKILSLASPSTIGGLQQIFEATLFGATLFKLDLQRLSLERVLEVVRARRITLMLSTPAVWRAVARIEGAREALASLRCIQTSGEVLLRVDLVAVRRVLPADCHVLSVYGATEAPALLQWFVHGEPSDEARVPGGYALPDIDILIVDETGKVAPDGEPGELVIRSHWTALGLWRQGKVTPGTFEPDPKNPARRLYRTGDLARRRPDGLVVLLGRKDRQIKIRGNRIELADIESALQRAPFVADAAVVARMIGDTPQLLAFVVPQRGAAGNVVDAARVSLRASLPAHMRPGRILALDEIPLLPGRKVDEEALLRRADAPLPPGTPHRPNLGDAGAQSGSAQSGSAQSGPPTHPSTRAASLVAQAWRRTLGRRPPATNATFDEVSGDSLRLVQLVFHLERLSGVPLPLERFHGELRPSEFALELDRQMGTLGMAVPQGRPVVFFVPGYGGDEPALGRLRAACLGPLDIRPLVYPGIESLAAPGFQFSDIADAVVEQIERSGVPDPIILAGYSIGGDVAFEAARKLRQKGRRLALLCIFDTDASGSIPPIPPRDPHAPSGKIARLRHIVRGGHWNELIAKLLPAASVVRPPAIHVARRFGVLDRLLPTNAMFFLRRHFQEALIRDRHAMRPPRAATALDSPMVLFRSQEDRPGAPSDLGWGRYATDVTVVAVGGGHFTMFAAENISQIAQEFAAAVTAAD